MQTKKLKTVAMIGRPNVGKSTLFNRLAGKRIAIETPVAGTTRDRLYFDISWSGNKFSLIDVAGVETGTKDEINRSIQESVDIAINEADLILFIVDWNEKENELDKFVARKLRKTKKPTLLIVNKADNIQRQRTIDEFKRLGDYEIIPASAISGQNTGDLLDAICKKLSEIPDQQVEREIEEELIKLAVIGRPNVGKSTLLNTIIGEKRAVVSAQAGTTRDIVKVSFFHKGKKIDLVDTAGIRRRGKIVKDTFESFGNLRTERALRESDIAVLVIDAVEGLVANDAHILGQAKETGKGIILAVNKIDLINGNKEEFINEMLWRLQIKLNFVPWLPVVFISAQDEENIKPLLDQIVKVYRNRQTKISEQDMSEIVNFIKSTNNQLVNLKSIIQKDINPPTFTINFSGKRMPHDSQIRFIENKIRDAFPMEGTPIFLDIQQKVRKRKS